jgi:hypothetical protein
MTWTQDFLFTSNRGAKRMDGALFASRVATMSLGVLGVMGAMLSHRHLWNGGVLGQQAAAGVGNSYRPRRAAEGSVAGSVGTGTEIAGLRFGSRIAPRNSGEPGAGFHRLSGNSARSAGIGGVVLAMLLLGLLATWIPAQRALGADPLMLLREE